MKEFVVACVQIAIKPFDIEYNIEKTLKWLKMAVEEHSADLVVFPESITTGFTPGMPASDFYKTLDVFPGFTTRPIMDAAKEYGVYVAYPTYEKGEKENIIYNSVALISPRGEIVGTYRKTHPFPTERLEGGGWTTPGYSAEVYDTELGKIGMILCYDGDFPELSRVLALKGAEVIIRPSALLRSYDIWNMTNHARAYDNHVYFIAVNAVGPDAANNYYFGNSMVINPIAQKLAQARGVEEIVSAKLDPDPMKYVTYGTKAPQIFDHIQDRNLESYKGILTAGKSAFEPSKRIPY